MSSEAHIYTVHVLLTTAHCLKIRDFFLTQNSVYFHIKNTFAATSFFCSTQNDIPDLEKHKFCRPTFERLQWIVQIVYICK